MNEHESAATHISQHEGLSFADLVRLESGFGNPEELLPVGKIDKASPEFAILAESGLPEELILSGEMTRGKLLEAGLVFKNRMGRGEKPVINEPQLSSRILLTQQELEGVIQEQQKNRNLIGPEDLEQVREKMMSVLEEACVIKESRASRAVDLFRKAQQYILGSDKVSERDRLKVAGFFKEQFELLQKGGISAVNSFFVESCIQGIDVLKVRGVPFEAVVTRASSLQGAPSPFIDSGFHFGEIMDITLFPNEALKTRRLNTAVVHLLSRGLDEVGGSLNGSHDQTYITAEEFAALFVSGVVENHEADAGINQQDSGWSDEELLLVSRRIIARAEQRSLET